MTVLTESEISKQFRPTSDEINKYFKRHPSLPRTKTIIGRVKDRIKASKIAKAPGKEASFTQSAAEWQIIYGTVRVGGVITFVGTSGNNNQYLHLVVTLAGHQIDAIEKVYLDDEEVVLAANPGWSTGIIRQDGSVASAINKIFLSTSFGTNGQPTNSDLNANLPSLWTANHTQDGCAYAYLIFEWDVTLFQNLPEITFLVRGKPIQLPGGAVTHSANAAGCIRDFLMDTRYGMGVPLSEIDATQYETAFNICDEFVGIIGGGQERRYTVNCAFKSSDSPQEILETMCGAMGGSITYVNGLWKIYPAAYRSPTIELTEADILSDIRVQTKLSRRDSFNGVRGTFISPINGYEETDFPAIKNDYYKTLDNNERVWEDIQLPATTSAATAQRLAKIELERNRQSISVQLTAGLRAYQVEPLDTLTLTIPRLGWNAKVFEVQESTLILEEGNGQTPYIAVQLLLRETASAIYTWADGSETSYDLAPNTTLPSPLSVPSVTGLLLESGTDQLYIRNDGTVFSRIKVSWDALTDFFVTSGGHIQIQYKKSSDSNWTAISAVPGEISNIYILDVKDGIKYDVRVRAVNSLNIYGAWNTYSNYTVIGKTEKPSNVANFSASIESFGIRFSWDKVPDLDVNLYEIRIGEVGASWESSDLLTQVNASTYAANIRLASEYQFFIKAIDTSGNYSLEAATLLSSIVGPEAPIATAEIIDKNFLIKWQIPSSLFAIDSYEVAYGAPSDLYANRTFIANVRGTSFQSKVEWGGVRHFWITGIDVAGNYGTPYQVSLAIESPSVVNSLTTQILDQFVLLRWSEPTTKPLPIEKYLVYKGSNFNTATLVGEVSGTFSSLFELAGGTYTYWVVAVDSANNQGTQIGVTVIVQPPDDFVLIETGDPENLTDFIAPNTGSGIRVSSTSDSLIMPVDESETWSDHFSNNLWNTTQDAIDAGYLYYVQPAPANAYWQRVIDYGGVVETALITLDFNRVDYDGSVDLVTKISWSTDNITWSAEVETQQILATNFRYVKIRFEIGTFTFASGQATGNIGLTYP